MLPAWALAGRPPRSPTSDSFIFPGFALQERRSAGSGRAGWEGAIGGVCVVHPVRGQADCLVAGAVPCSCAICWAGL
jgi:hypothetical protein